MKPGGEKADTGIRDDYKKTGKQEDEKTGKHDGKTNQIKLCEMKQKIQNHWQLEVYRLSVDAAMEIYGISKKFPKEETYSLTDQIRRSSRSVSCQIAEGWRRRKYKAAFVNKFNEAEGEAGETQVWVEFAVKCDYINRETGKDLHNKYKNIIGKLITMGNNPEKWTLENKNSQEDEKMRRLK